MENIIRKAVDYFVANAFLLLKEIIRATFGHEHIFKGTGVSSKSSKSKLRSGRTQVKKILKATKSNHCKKQSIKRELLQLLIL